MHQPTVEAKCLHTPRPKTFKCNFYTTPDISCYLVSIEVNFKIRGGFNYLVAQDKDPLWGPLQHQSTTLVAHY